MRTASKNNEQLHQSSSAKWYNSAHLTKIAPLQTKNITNSERDRWDTLYLTSKILLVKIVAVITYSLFILVHVLAYITNEKC